MGFWSTVGKVAAPITAAFPNMYNEGDHGQADPALPQNTYIPVRSKNNSAQGLADSIFGTNDPSGYSSVFDQGYQNLNQPLHDPSSDRRKVAVEGTRALAAQFADAFHKRTGQLPSEEQIRGFVSQNLTPGFAAKFIQGMPPDQIASQADQYINDNPDIAGGAAGSAQSRILGLNDQLDKAYGAARDNFVNDYNSNVYTPAKTTVANDLAGQGMLTQPNSRYSLDAVEATRGKDIGAGLGALAQKRAEGSVDLGKTLEGLLQSQQGITNQNSQFNKTFNANREDTSFNQGMQRQGLSMADQIGKLQAKNNEKGPLDYLNTAINAAGTVAKIPAVNKWLGG